MAQVNDIIKDNIISRALSVCELADGETMCLPQNTFARIRVRTQEQFLALQARRAAIQGYFYLLKKIYLLSLYIKKKIGNHSHIRE